MKTKTQHTETAGMQIVGVFEEARWAWTGAGMAVFRGKLMAVSAFMKEKRDIKPIP